MKGMKDMKSLRVANFIAASCIAAGFTVAGLSSYAYADGCEYDTQCKGDRICENKICVPPQAANFVAKPTGQNSSLPGGNNKSQAAEKDTYFCCTLSEKLGPFSNPESDGKTYSVGDVCSGTSKSARHFVGRVCK